MSQNPRHDVEYEQSLRRTARALQSVIGQTVPAYGHSPTDTATAPCANCGLLIAVRADAARLLDGVNRQLGLIEDLRRAEQQLANLQTEIANSR